jgi:hypothetical protein
MKYLLSTSVLTQLIRRRKALILSHNQLLGKLTCKSLKAPFDLPVPNILSVNNINQIVGW